MADVARWNRSAYARCRVTKDQAEATLKSAGYTQITKIGADDVHWEGEGMKDDGKQYEFEIDPHDGKIMRMNWITDLATAPQKPASADFRGRWPRTHRQPTER